MNKFYIWIFFILFILIASKFKIKDNKIKYDFTNVNIEILFILNNYLVGGARHGYWHLRYFFENFSGRYDHGKKVGYIMKAM